MDHDKQYNKVTFMTLIHVTYCQKTSKISQKISLRKIKF